MAPLRYAAKFDLFPGLRHPPSTLVQSKERKGSNFAIWQHWSKVVQKLIYPLDHIENMLNILVSSTRMEKVFIFDVVSKIYVATDSSPVDITM